jgi:hypothetical protein
LDHWREANATWHRHPADVPADVLSLFIFKRWHDAAKLWRKSKNSRDKKITARRSECYGGLLFPPEQLRN